MDTDGHRSDGGVSSPEAARHKLKQLFERSRGETAPAPAAGFEARVVAAIRREARPPLEAPGLWEQIGLLFSPLAFGAAAVIAACVLADYWVSARSGDLTDGARAISEQWLFAANGD